MFLKSVAWLPLMQKKLQFLEMFIYNVERA